MASPASRILDRPLIHLGLLVATVGTTWLTYFVFHTAGTKEDAPGALAFSFTAIAILGSHEMGHYIAARLHGVSTTLPYFIPFPLGFGTLGAVIRIRSRIPTRNALVDIGAAGPLTGLLVAIPLLYWGLRLSTLEDITPMDDPFPHQFSLVALVPRIVAWVSETAAGTWQPSPLRYGYGEPLLLQGLEYLVFGPLPETKTIIAHPMVLAGWFGLLVTTLNLFPIGQLDGGHVTFAVFGERARWVGRVASWGLLGLTLFFSVSWLLWWFLTRRVIGLDHPEVTAPHQPLSRGRLFASVLCWVALALTLLPAPMQVFFE